MNFELIDNSIQIILLAGMSLASLVLTLKYHDRRCIILSLAYASYAMGTIYFVLHVAIAGNPPDVFYVSEISWIAAYLFFLSLMIVRTEGTRSRLSLIPILGAIWVIVTVMIANIGGPSYFITGMFAFTSGSIAYMALFRLIHTTGTRKVDICLLVCIVLQLSLYLSSQFMKDFTVFNLYFAIDFALTGCLVALLPLTLMEVKKQ